ncbi:hypothetical protein HPP92_026131 [Vanilla planifolia]|uniref:Protein LURP-one-related 15 n=1 Tax=Vanilla planifolia TaxID=51239 RepID=A0A835PKX6_VANPL|nr:hypothetical protein HPP92_026131 [Vanilla planifolia]
MAMQSLPPPTPLPPPSGPACGVVVVSPQFCAPYPVDLTATKRSISLTDGDFGVTDVNGNTIMRVKGTLLSLRDRRVLFDAAGNPLVSMHQKIISIHRRWQVFRGDSSSTKDLLFSARKSSLLQFKTELDVFLASNSGEHRCDFKMSRHYTAKNIVLGKEAFGISIYPNVDYAFVVSLIVILDEINKDRKD